MSGGQHFQSPVAGNVETVFETPQTRAKLSTTSSTSNSKKRKRASVVGPRMEHVMMIDHVEGAETWEYPIAKMQSRADLEDNKKKEKLSVNLPKPQPAPKGAPPADPQKSSTTSPPKPLRQFNQTWGWQESEQVPRPTPHIPKREVIPAREDEVYVYASLNGQTLGFQDLQLVPNLQLAAAHRLRHQLLYALSQVDNFIYLHTPPEHPFIESATPIPLSQGYHQPHPSYPPNQYQQQHYGQPHHSSFPQFPSLQWQNQPHYSQPATNPGHPFPVQQHPPTQ